MRVWLFFPNIGNTDDHPDGYSIRRFREAAAAAGIECHVFRPQDFVLSASAQNGCTAHLANDAAMPPVPDAIIVRTGAETTAYMMAVLRHFERMGVLVVSAPAAIETAGDKWRTMQILAAHNIPIPSSQLVRFPVSSQMVGETLGYPIIVKKTHGLRGTGVLKCTDAEQLDDTLGMMRHDYQGTDEIILQSCITASHGRDVRVIVVNGKAIGAMLRQSSGGFKSNLALGGTATAFDAPPKVLDIAERAARALSLDIAGIDILFTDNGYCVCEANSAPGFKGFEQACDLDVAAIILESVRTRCAATQANAPTALAV